MIELLQLAHLQVPLIHYVARYLHFLVCHIAWQPMRYHVLFELAHEFNIVK